MQHTVFIFLTHRWHNEPMNEFGSCTWAFVCTQWGLLHCIMPEKIEARNCCQVRKNVGGKAKWREAYMPKDIRKLHFFCPGMYSSSCFDLWILVSNAHLMVKLLPIQLERFVLSKWHVLLYCVVHYIGCRISSGWKKMIFDY